MGYGCGARLFEQALGRRRAHAAPTILEKRRELLYRLGIGEFRQRFGGSPAEVAVGAGKCLAEQRKRRGIGGIAKLAQEKQQDELARLLHQRGRGGVVQTAGSLCQEALDSLASGAGVGMPFLGMRIRRHQHAVRLAQAPGNVHQPAFDGDDQVRDSRAK